MKRTGTSGSGYSTILFNKKFVATAETIPSKETELSAALLNGHLTSAGVAPQLELDKLGPGSCALIVAKPIVSL